jgi:hypothetical protein
MSLSNVAPLLDASPCERVQDYRVFQEELLYLRRTFLKLNYIDVSKNTFVSNGKFTEIMERKVLNM